MGDRRTALLDAASICFDDYGYAATTIDMIRQQADASVGSLYHHFGSKEALATALYLDRLSDYENGYDEVLQSTTDAEAGVRGVVAHHLRWAQVNPVDARFLLDHMHLERSLARSGELPSENRRFYRRVQAWLDRQVDTGLIRPLSADLYNALWLGPAQELTRQWLVGRSRTNPADVVAVLSDVAWASLRGESSNTGEI